MTALRRAVLAVLLAILAAPAVAHDEDRDFATELNAAKQIREGRQTFRYATFGDEAFWGDLLGLHRAVAGQWRGRSGREP